MQFVLFDPLGDPMQVAVAGEESTPETETSQRLVEVEKRGLGKRGHWVSVHGQKG